MHTYTLEPSHVSFLKPPVSQSLKAGYVALQPGEHMHEHVTDSREELIIVHEGTATVTVDGSECIVEAGQCVFIPEGRLHAVENRGTLTLRYMYVVSMFTRSA